MIINEKKKTDGKTNLKTETTEALIANEDKGKKSLLPGKSRLKKQNKGGEKTDSSDNELAQGNGNEHIQQAKKGDDKTNSSIFDEKRIASWKQE